MEIVSFALLGIGVIIMLIGGIMMLIEAFKEHVLWGLGWLLVPFVSLVFLIMHWAKAKKGFFIWLIGLPFYIIGMVLLVTVAQPQ